MSNLKRWVVLVDAGCDWPDVVFVGTWDEACAFDRSLEDHGLHTSIQAVVTMDEVESWRAEASA